MMLTCRIVIEDEAKPVSDGGLHAEMRGELEQCFKMAGEVCRVAASVKRDTLVVTVSEIQDTEIPF